MEQRALKSLGNRAVAGALFGFGKIDVTDIQAGN